MPSAHLRLATAQEVSINAHEVAFADSDKEARQIFDSEAAHLTVSGSAVLVKSNSNSSGRLNLTITVPRSAKVTVDAGHGDVTAAGLGSGLNLTAGHGDVHLSAIDGSVRGSFSQCGATTSPRTRSTAT